MLTGVWESPTIGLNEEIKFKNNLKKMGHWEDFWYDITEDINKKGLKKEFDAQLTKMGNQDKHKYKDSRGRWDYAYHKVIKLYENKKSKTVV